MVPLILGNPQLTTSTLKPRHLQARNLWHFGGEFEFSPSKGAIGEREGLCIMQALGSAVPVLRWTFLKQRTGTYEL